MVLKLHKHVCLCLTMGLILKEDLFYSKFELYFETLSMSEHPVDELKLPLYHCSQ